MADRFHGTLYVSNSEMHGDTDWVRASDYAAAEARIRELEAENIRLKMEMAAYRQGCTPKDAAAMLAVVAALEVEKQDRRSRFDSRRCPNMAHKRYNLYLCTECSPSENNA